MVLSTRNDGRFLWEKWHQFRQRARETEPSEENFSETEQERYDLDTARITGEEQRNTFINTPFEDDTFNVLDLKDTR